jgi:hypothetical protein
MEACKKRENIENNSYPIINLVYQGIIGAIIPGEITWQSIGQQRESGVEDINYKSCNSYTTPRTII